jgi:hypothetical protein
MKLVDIFRPTENVLRLLRARKGGRNERTKIKVRKERDLKMYSTAQKQCTLYSQTECCHVVCVAIDGVWIDEWIY